MGSFNKLCYLIILIASVETSSSDENRTSTEQRQGRANGYMIKLYSGTKTDPVMCPKEGFLADPVDCSIFYRCIKTYNEKYTVYKFKCGPGTVYDPDTEICNHAGNTKRTECGGIQVFDDDDKNMENEIEGSQELPNPIITKSPVIFENTPGDKVTSTNYPTTSTVKNLVSPSTHSTTEDPVTSHSPNLWTTLSTKPSKEMTITNVQKGDECIKDGFIGDSENCRKFYRCVSNNHRGFIRYEFLCSELTIWDDDLQSCNHPWAVRRRRCGRGDDTHYSTESNDILDNNVVNEPQFNYGEKVTEDQKEIITDKVNQNKTQVSIDDKYIGYPNEPDIGENLYISSQITSSPAAIDEPSTNSASKKPQLEVTDGYIHQYTQKPLLSHLHKQTSTNSINKGELEQTTQSIISSECSKNGYIGDINDCRKFYRCVGNGRGRYIKYGFMCSQGTAWDSKLDACNYVWAVKECGEKRQSEAVIKDVNKGSTTISISSIQPITVTTELDSSYGNQYNNDREKLTTTTTLIPIEQSYLNNECLASGFFGDLNDCQIFFRCIDNGKGKFIKYVYKCDVGTFWDTTTQSCNYIDKSTTCVKELESNKTILPDKNSNKISTPLFVQFTTEQNTQSNMLDKDYSKNNTLSYIDTYKPIYPHTYTSTKRSINKNHICQSTGFFGDSDDCKTFYRCVDNGDGDFTQHTFSCGEGTVWDSSIEACNHAWAVKECAGISSTSKDTMLHSTTTSYPEKEDEGYFTQSNHDTSNNIHSTISGLTTIQTTTSQSIKTTRSTSINKCTKSGFRGDTYDCIKFYRCVDDGNGGYTQYEFSCGDGTAWDPNIEACNHKRDVEKCSSKEEEIKAVVMPSNTENIIQSSESVNVFQTTRNYDTTTLRVTSSSQSSILLESQAIDNQNRQTSLCESEGFHADVANCRNFYRCVDNGKGDYTKYEFTCGEGTTWNQKIMACDYIENTGCSTNKAKPNKTPTESTTIAIIQQQISETPQEEEISTFSETNQCNSEGFYANPNDCSKFYRCVSDGKGSYIKYDFSCGEGTIWIQENQVCDYDTGIANCSITTTTTESISTNGHSTSTYFTTTTAQKQNDENNDVECKSAGFYPHESNCKKFYRCVDEGNGKYTRYDYTCGEGTAWDTNIQSCNHINEVKRCETQQTSTQETKPSLEDEQAHSESNHYTDTTKLPSSTTQSTKPSTSSTQSNKNTGTTKPSTYTTESNKNTGTTKPSSYTTESNKNTGTTYHSTSTTESNKNQGTTKPPVSTTASSKPAKQDKCEEEGYFGSSSNCKNFYRCVSNQNGNYTKYDFTCGEGTIWDQNIIGCNHPENVVNASCKSSDNNEITTTSSSSSTSTSESSNNHEATSLSSSSQGTSTQSFTESSEHSDNKPSNNTYTCTEAGFFADPNDCKKFYRCVDWDNRGEKFSIFHFDCGEGTSWDQSLLTCNHEDSVDCSTQQHGQNNTEETSSSTVTSTTESTRETSTQPYTTTEPSTTQTSTSQKPTTEKTTTQKSTTQKSTTQKQTTQKSTTQKSTTQKSTTQESTTQKSTTQESTTQESTTQKPTTEKSTTQKSTTQESTTQESTTQKSTTTTTTTEQSTTSQPSTEETSTQTSSSSEQTTSDTTEQSTTSTTNSANETTTQDQTSTTAEQTTEHATSTTTKAPDQSTQTDKTTTQESSTQSSTTDQTETTTESSSANKDCPQTNEGEYLFVCPTSFRRHPKYCNLFYQCTEDDDTHESKIATFHCPNNTIYDEKKVQCVEEKKADKKCQGEIASRRRVKRLGVDYKEPITVGKEKMACQTSGYHLFEKNEECSPAFLKCELTKRRNLRGYVYRCPEGYLYWTISRRCEAIRNIKDCKRSSFDWSGRNEIPIEKLNVAP